MDIDSLRALLREGRYRVTQDFRRQQYRRGFEESDAARAIESGEIVEERKNEKPYPKCTVAAVIPREVAGVIVMDKFHLGVAVGPLLVFITGYWKNDRIDRKGWKRT